ncbi:SIR2 family protein [Magnetospirillum fulvum]|uniref:SIR2 family protein n=1 Tax=Magnetospirillum fulvum TaxID=1082 RepID=UPI001B8C11FC|nr:SIR2 family protein [Magnetospirillum fulvum]
MDGQKAQESQTRYSRYAEEIGDDIADTVQQFGCQPILFVGSGLAKRYMGTPNWDELLSHLATHCTAIDKGLGFYKQSLITPMRIGEEFAKIYQEWAWTAGHNEFPEEMFGESVGAQSYIKYKIASYINSLTPIDASKIGKDEHKKEISSLTKIKPHAIITTNYDRMLEMLFPDHEPIIGQNILKGQQVYIGEIYKIHGSVTDPDSIVFTESDYREFQRKKKFLSAKLLTFFNEHPLIFIGYSATDPNIRSILSDIDEALPEKGGVIPNVYILQWNPQINEDSVPPREKVIPTEDDRTIRVKLIEAADFGWVFDAFSTNPALNDVNPRILRALIARSYDLVRHDIPKLPVHVDFKMLTESVENSNSFAKLFGIANIDDYSFAAVQHPLSATQLGKLLGGNGWHTANALLDKLKQITGTDIKSSDNKYHRSELVNTTKFHKYSNDCLNLLESVRDGLPFELNLGLPSKNAQPAHN